MLCTAMYLSKLLWISTQALTFFSSCFLLLWFGLYASGSGTGFEKDLGNDDGHSICGWSWHKEIVLASHADMWCKAMIKARFFDSANKEKNYVSLKWLFLVR